MIYTGRFRPKGEHFSEVLNGRDFMSWKFGRPAITSSEKKMFDFLQKKGCTVLLLVGILTGYNHVRRFTFLSLWKIVSKRLRGWTSKWNLSGSAG